MFFSSHFLPKDEREHPHIFFVFVLWRRESERERRRHRLAHVIKNNGIFQQRQRSFKSKRYPLLPPNPPTISTSKEREEMRVSPSPFTILLFFSRKKKKKIFDLLTFSCRRHHFSLLKILPLSLSLSLSFRELKTKQNKTAKRDDILITHTLVADNMLVRAIFKYVEKTPF